MAKRALLILLPWLSACGAPEVSSDIGSLEQAIVHGDASDSSDDSVLYVLAHDGSGSSACSGTLIAPNLVITALHCITYANAGQFSCNADGTISTTNPGDGNIGQLLPAANVEVFWGNSGAENALPAAIGKRLFGTGTTQICRNDLALILLDRDLDAPIIPLRLGAPVEKGEYVSVVGFGQTETSGTSGRYRREGRRVVDVGPDSDAEATATTTATPRTFVIDEGPCHGDSGGPALSEDTGALLGVYSLASGVTVASCMQAGVRNVFTRASSFSTLIMSAFDAAGTAPLPEVAEPEAPAGAQSSGCSFSASVSPSPMRWGAPGGLLAALLWRRRQNRRSTR